MIFLKMDNETRKRLEYEEQFYGMSSEFLVDSFKNFTKNELLSKIDMLVNDFKNKIINQAENLEKFNHGISEMKISLVDNYISSIKETFSAKEPEIFDLLRIPPNVLLQEDFVAKNGINANINLLKKEIEDLEKTFKSMLNLKQEILEELEDADSAIFYLKDILNDAKFDLKILPVEEVCKLSVDNKNVINNF